MGALLARAMFPDPGRIERALADYRSGAGGQLFTWEVGGRVVCAAGVRTKTGSLSAELRHIGTDPAHRGQGYGRALLRAVAGVLDAQTLWAETDEDAAGFYRRCGFTVTETASAWGRRLRCVLSLPAAP